MTKDEKQEEERALATALMIGIAASPTGIAIITGISETDKRILIDDVFNFVKLFSEKVEKREQEDDN